MVMPNIRLMKLIPLLLVALAGCASARQVPVEVPMEDVTSFCPASLKGAQTLHFDAVPSEEMRAVMIEEFSALGPHNEHPVEFSNSAVDLNFDGLDDEVTLSKHPLYCGSSGCQVHAFIQNVDGTYNRVFLFPAGAGQIHVLPYVTNGLRLLLLKKHSPQDVNQYALYAWNGVAYESHHACTLQTP